MTEDDILDLEKSLNKIPELKVKTNAAMRKSMIKRGMAFGIKFDSHWEYIFYKYMHDYKGYVVERNKLESIPYIDTTTGKQRKFFPDFKVNGLFYEIKGRWSQTDLDKMDQCPQVKFYSVEEITMMEKELNKNLVAWNEDFIQISGRIS
jgi:hypothetical protein